MSDVFDSFDDLQCEDFYTEADAGVCEVDSDTTCIDCGACSGELYEDDDVCEGILGDPTVNLFADDDIFEGE